MTPPFGDDVPEAGTPAAAGSGAAPEGGGRPKGSGRRDGPAPAKADGPPAPAKRPAPGGAGKARAAGPEAAGPEAAPSEAPAGGGAAPAPEEVASGQPGKPGRDPFRLEDLTNLEDIRRLADLDDIVEGELIDVKPPTKEDDVPVDAAAAAGIPYLTEVQQLRAERDEYLDALKRLQADFVNFRNRVERQYSEEANRRVAVLVENLLPVLDATQLAAEHAGDDKDGAAIAQVAALLWDTLQKVGLARVDEVGVPFEPTVHDAVLHVPAEEGAEDAGPVVDAVMRPGFLFRGKCLRPAMVQVRG